MWTCLTQLSYQQNQLIKILAMFHGSNLGVNPFYSSKQLLDSFHLFQIRRYLIFYKDTISYDLDKQRSLI